MPELNYLYIIAFLVLFLIVSIPALRIILFSLTITSIAFVGLNLVLSTQYASVIASGPVPTWQIIMFVVAHAVIATHFIWFLLKEPNSNETPLEMLRALRPSAILYSAPLYIFPYMTLHLTSITNAPVSFMDLSSLLLFLMCFTLLPGIVLTLIDIHFFDKKDKEEKTAVE